MTAGAGLGNRDGGRPSTALTGASLAGFIVLVLVIVALFLRGAILAEGPIALAVQAAAVALMLWARVTFGRRSFHATASPTEGGLVTTGPYRYLRHPIYAAVLWFIWAAALSHASPIALLLALAACVGAALRIVAEERLLRMRYPGYAEYAARTRRVIPFVL